MGLQLLGIYSDRFKNTMRKIIFAIFLGIAILFWITPKTVSAQGCACDLEWVDKTGYNADGSTFTYFTWWCPQSCGNLNTNCAAGYYGCQDASGNASCCENGGPSCFLAGIKIQSPEGDINIEDVKIGDVVYTFANDLISKSTVVNTLQSNRDFYYELEAGNYKVSVAAEHRFYVGNGNFTEVQYLKIGDIVYVMEGMKLSKKKVTSNTKITKSADVYNLSIDKTHTYFANDFAVHNIKCMCPGTYEACSGNPEVCQDKCLPRTDPNDCSTSYDPNPHRPPRF